MYRPSSPRYARMPESTLTPAPVKTVILPDLIKSASISVASARDWIDKEGLALRMA